jgi:hypothetical protein
MRDGDGLTAYVPDLVQKPRANHQTRSLSGARPELPKRGLEGGPENGFCIRLIHWIEKVIHWIS